MSIVLFIIIEADYNVTCLRIYYLIKELFLILLTTNKFFGIKYCIVVYT